MNAGHVRDSAGIHRYNLYIYTIYKLLVVSCCYAWKLLTLKELK